MDDRGVICYDRAIADQRQTGICYTGLAAFVAGAAEPELKWLGNFSCRKRERIAL